MNSIEALLVELVAMGETPLYSAYRWVERDVGAKLDLRAFLDSVDRLLSDDALQLWHIEFPSGDRTELFTVDPNLAQRYVEANPSDDTYDPFALSLTRGPKSEVPEPEWRVKLNHEKSEFELVARNTSVQEAIRALARYFPDLTLKPLNEVIDGDLVVVSGMIHPE